jgi:hypothetical protein
VLDAVENKLLRTTNLLFVDGLDAFEADLMLPQIAEMRLHLHGFDKDIVANVQTGT